MNIKFKQASLEYVTNLKSGDEVYVASNFYGKIKKISKDKIKTITKKKREIKTEMKYHLNSSGHSLYEKYSMSNYYIIEPTKENLKNIEFFSLFCEVINNFEKEMINEATEEELLFLKVMINRINKRSKENLND